MHHARGCPFQMGLMASGAMLFLREYPLSAVTTGMRSHALSLVKELHGRRRRADLHEFVNQVVWHAVEVAVENDVVIDVYPRARPLTHVETLGRQGLQSTAFDLCEYAGARPGPFFERSLI